MERPSSSSIPEQQTIEHDGSTLMQPQYINDSTAPHSISPSIPEILSNFLPSHPLLPNQMNPVPGNQVWIILNMTRTHIETHCKVSPRIRYHWKSSLGPTEANASGSSSCKFDTFIHQDRGEHKLSTPPAIWPNWNKIFWTYLKISSAIR